jgi:hypothetical protein
MEEELIYTSGIDADSGDYLHAPVSPIEILKLIRGHSREDEHLKDMKAVAEGRKAHFGISGRVDYKKLNETGWGVIFAGEPEAWLLEALKPLLEWRKELAGPLYRECRGAKGYMTDDTKQSFLARNNAATSGLVRPSEMPYYLMIVGDPETIPYEFQYQLDVQYGVGRLSFDKPEEYAQYAASVVAAEQKKIVLPRRAVFFGPESPGDGSTIKSSQFLLAPLKEFAHKDQAGKWEVERIAPAESTKVKLGRLMGGEETPAFLFTASHGLGRRYVKPEQVKDQGALICQEWTRGTTLPMDAYAFGAGDLGADVNPAGMIAMLFACYGAGTPKYNEFYAKDQKDAKTPEDKAKFAEANQLAEKAFVAALPKRLLSHPKGSALAVIGHVERAWTTSFLGGGVPRTATYEEVIQKLLDGFPVGYATEGINGRYAELSSDLLGMLSKLKIMARPTVELVNDWLETFDTRNHSVIGDPAVKLCVAEEGSSVAPVREEIQVNFVAPVAEVANPVVSYEIVTEGPDGSSLVTRGSGSVDEALWAKHKAAVEAAMLK